MSAQARLYTYVKGHVGMPDQALGWFHLSLGLVVEDKSSELSCTCTLYMCVVLILHSQLCFGFTLL